MKKSKALIHCFRIHKDNGDIYVVALFMKLSLISLPTFKVEAVKWSGLQPRKKKVMYYGHSLNEAKEKYLGLAVKFDLKMENFDEESKRNRWTWI